MKRKEHRKRFRPRISPRLREELISVLTKIIGETVKDKVVRALLIGVLSSLGNYVDSVTQEESAAPVEVKMVEEAKPESKKAAE
ncbi:hypothetical protein H6S68_gp92 [Pseudomonas phage Epa7]|uniref:Phage protein n=41 Tax=Viruses TaxID=10239 RepID=A0A2K8IAH1_9CAUD|nr:hypothetical protein [Staphylococcus aureus]YP_002364356.1 hypothetical protein PP141_gp48 [Pseudomonas phage 14-1]YP_002418855.1 hypothetical protein PPSN_gp49 [Pseudomonas phage SN]YP_006200813.1 hypothetical protein F358_gp48 [Pseudomonas phage JG024]YP_009124369.1 hypothetical protein VA96_gp66 [Pseudomonas phage vB_PaeM_PAO1_Ab27]YP_009215180.1 hypothetical protein AVU24_gp62 [Pseudomonas phage DL68]YP_009593285.1 hypothetical protein FDG82_gp47 [Pseudomonas phage phiKTN6]YP_00961947